jgi:hypothetical protein
MPSVDGDDSEKGDALVQLMYQVHNQLLEWPAMKRYGGIEVP